MRYCQTCHRCFSDAVTYCLMDQHPTLEIRQLPQIIEGKYRLEQLIAHGGMGSVYRATHLQLERPVAIKILRPEFFTDEKIVARFHREALAAARLRHPNIIAIYDFGMIGESVPQSVAIAPDDEDILDLEAKAAQASASTFFSAFIVMELIEGRSLREEMRSNAARNGLMSCERAVSLIRQVCAGIAAAHQHGVIHRDLKPDNIMIEMQPSDAPGGFAEIVKVLDFGIARLMDTGQPLQSLTEEGTFIGTPSYISPEQCTEQPVDARSDVYSVGVILYEMITGRVPFAGSDAASILLKKLYEQPVAPGRFRPDLNPMLERVMMNALSRSPHQRPASALELSRLLSEAMQAAPVFSEITPVTMERQIPHTAWPLEQQEPLAIVPAEAQSEEEIVFVRDEEFRSNSAGEMREPQLLPLDAQPRRLWLPIAALLLLGVSGVFIWQKFLALPQPAGNSFAALNQGAKKLPSKQAQAEVSASSVAGPAISPSPAASQAVSTNTTIPASLSTTIESQSPEPSPATRATITAASKEEWKQELSRIFHAWAMSATRGNWQQHAKFYADSVQYFREGAISPAAVLARKQKVFGETGSYQLQFSQMPMVNFQNRGKAVEAEIIFDKQWVINKGRNVTEGKSSSALRLRREPLGWRIIGEKQLQTYYHRTRKVAAK